MTACDKNPRTCPHAPANQLVHKVRTATLRWPAIRKSMVAEIVRIGSSSTYKKLLSDINDTQRLLRDIETALIVHASTPRSGRVAKRVGRVHEGIAECLADWLSTMWCLWFVLALVSVPLIWNRPESLYGWAQYLSTAVFQAAALPVLAFVSKVETKRQTKLLKETRDAEMTELEMLKSQTAAKEKGIDGD